MANIFRLLKPFDSSPLPDFPRIDWREIPAASALLFYGGPKITEIAGNRLYHHPYHPPAFHATLYLGNGDMLNVGKFKTIEQLPLEFRSTRRIDAVIYAVNEDVRDRIVRDGYRDVDKPKIGFQLPTYGITDFLRFGIKWWKPSKKDICSENVTEIMGANGVTVSSHEPYNTAPWDLLEYAMTFPINCAIRMVWKGDDFK